MPNNRNQKHNQEDDDNDGVLLIGDLLPLKEAAELNGYTHGHFKHLIQKRPGETRPRLRAKRIGYYWFTTQAAVDEYKNNPDIEHRK